MLIFTKLLHLFIKIQKSFQEWYCNAWTRNMLCDMYPQLHKGFQLQERIKCIFDLSRKKERAFDIILRTWAFTQSLWKEEFSLLLTLFTKLYSTVLTWFKPGSAATFLSQNPFFSLYYLGLCFVLYFLIL